MVENTGEREKLEMENLRLVMEFTTTREIDDVLKRIRAAFADEVQNSMKSGEGGRRDGVLGSRFQFFIFFIPPFNTWLFFL